MAHPPVIADQQLVKSMNRMVLLRILHGEPGMSRADLAACSGLTRSTVSVLIKELIDEGWLVESAAHVTGTPGRRPTPLSVDGARIMLVGAELGPDALCIVTTSIRGDVMESSQAPLRSKDPDAACHQLVEMITAHASKVIQGGARLLGIGVALHGAVDKRSGLLLFAPNIGWRNVEVGRYLDAELSSAGLAHVPVYFHNEATLAAVGEFEFGPRTLDDPLIYISCGIGVGAGIILNEALFTGATGSAGEIGHITLVIDGEPCTCGRRGCAEAYIGLHAIAAAAGGARDAPLDRAELRERMAWRHPATRAAFEGAGRSLGVLMQDMWATFNPSVIVLGGETVALGGETFLDAASSVLEDVATRVGMPAPAVRLTRHAERAAAVGAAAYVLHAILYPHQPAVHTRYSAAIADGRSGRGTRQVPV